MFGREPALWLGLIQTLIALSVGFGLNLTNQQTALILSASAAVIAFVTRSQVTPVVK